MFWGREGVQFRVQIAEAFRHTDFSVDLASTITFPD